MDDIKTHTLKEDNCNNCGAEYVLTFDRDETDLEPIHCPFCGEELEDYIIDEDDIEELDFDEE